VAENKTKANELSVAAFLESVSDDQRRVDAKALVALMQKASGEKPKMWGPSIIGFGSYHYVYDSGREGDMPVVGFSPRKAATVLYGLHGISGGDAMLAKLGKHSSGKGCIYVKKLSDINEDVLRTMVAKAVAAKRKQ
jgi:uncharacterized protein DUF1801